MVAERYEEMVRGSYRETDERGYAPDYVAPKLSLIAWTAPVPQSMPMSRRGIFLDLRSLAILSVGILMLFVLISRL